jgi:hypothetical protein
MAAAFAFLGMLLVSLLVAVLAALQLDDFFLTGDEFAFVLAVVTVLVVATMAALTAVYAKGGRLRAIHRAAWVLAAAQLALISLPGSVQWIANHSTNPYTIGSEQTAYRIEIAFPALLAVLAQWGLVRRRLLRTSGEDDLALWPWVSTVIAGLTILNPIGLAVIWTALNPQGGDMMWSLFAVIAASVAAVLVVMAVIECYIRGRTLRRRARL